MVRIILYEIIILLVVRNEVKMIENEWILE
jgi:hypothetical protein